jgi:hypothetical protein
MLHVMANWQQWVGCQLEAGVIQPPLLYHHYHRAVACLEMIISKDLFLLGDQDYLRLPKDEKRVMVRPVTKIQRLVRNYHLSVRRHCLPH